MATSASLLDGLLEIISSFTPTEAINTATFSSSNADGAYIIVSDPPGNTTQAQGQSQASQIFEMGFFYIYNHGPRGNTYVVEKQVPGTIPADFFTMAETLGDGVVTVTLSRHNFLPGYTYYLIRVKQ